MKHPESRPVSRPARRIVAAAAAVTATIVWAHAGAGLVRSMAGASDGPLAALELTLAAALTALAGSAAFDRPHRAALAAGIAGAVSAAIIAAIRPGDPLAALALVPVGAAFAAGGAVLFARLPQSLDRFADRRRWVAAAWVVLALLGTVQVGRLATYMTDRESDWFVGTRHPFYAKHECANAYVYAAELDRRGESNVYDADHYPGLNPEAKPETAIAGLVPEDPYQYPPQFLLAPRLAIALTGNFAVIRLVWFALNVTFCMGAVLGLGAWIGGRAGGIAALLSPAVLASFPVLHAFQYGQFHFAAIALAVLGMLAFSRRRIVLGGSLLAVAILAKLFPALLLVPLAAQRRFREIGWTVAAAAAITVVALGVLGPQPFVAFAGYHLPRLADGGAFSFADAWPELEGLIVAGNQGIAGIVQKLDTLGFRGMTSGVAEAANRIYGVALLALAALVGIRSRGASRVQRAIAWLGLLGLASLASAGAWGDYVPLTAVWLLAILAPLSKGRPALQVGLGIAAAFQVFLIGTLPLGSWTDPAWLIPLSLAGALSMLALFAGAALTRVPLPERKMDRQPAWDGAFERGPQEASS